MKLRALVGIVTAAAAIGCGDDDRGAPIDAGGTPGADAGGLLDAAGDSGELEDAGPHNCEGVWIERIEGRVVDESGAGIFEARAQACVRVPPTHTLLCLDPPLTEADGSYVIEVGGRARCAEGVAMRALKPGAPYGTTYCHVGVDGASDGVLALAEPAVLYATEPPASLPPLGDEATSRPVTFEDGLEIDVVPASLGFGVEYEALGARRVPLEGELPCFARDVAGLEGLYVFADEGPVLDGGFGFRVPNTTGLSASTTVEFLVLGGLDTTLAGTPVEEADFVPFATGTVSGDGAVISGEGLSYFTWLGYRRIP